MDEKNLQKLERIKHDLNAAQKRREAEEKKRKKAREEEASFEKMMQDSGTKRI